MSTTVANLSPKWLRFVPNGTNLRFLKINKAYGSEKKRNTVGLKSRKISLRGVKS